MAFVSAPRAVPWRLLRCLPGPFDPTRWLASAVTLDALSVLDRARRQALAPLGTTAETSSWRYAIQGPAAFDRAVFAPTPEPEWHLLPVDVSEGIDAEQERALRSIERSSNLALVLSASADDTEWGDVVEQDARETLTRLGFAGDEVPSVRVANGAEKRALLEALDALPLRGEPGTDKQARDALRAQRVSLRCAKCDQRISAELTEGSAKRMEPSVWTSDPPFGPRRFLWGDGVVRGFTRLDEGWIYVDPRAVRDLATTASHDKQSGCCGIPPMGGPHFRCGGGHTMGLVCTECSHGPNRIGFAPGEVVLGPAEGDEGVAYDT